MQVTKEPLEQCRVALTIEVEEDKVVLAVDRAYREYSKYVTVPGFRKGKAPQQFVRQRIPLSEVRQRVAEILVEPAYTEAISETNIVPFAQPELELVQLEESKPFIFKAVVPLAPKVELGMYTGIKIDKMVIPIPESAIDIEIERLRDREADYPKVERPIEQEDMVIADVSAVVDAKPSIAEPRGMMIEVGSDNIPGFDEEIIGLSVGDEKTFTLTYPKDYKDEELQGQTAEFTVKIKEIRAKIVPDLDDELAKKLSGGRAETVGDLRIVLREDAERSVERRINADLTNRLVEIVAENSKVSYPPIMLNKDLEEEIQTIQRQLQENGMTIEEYAMRQETTPDAIVDTLRAKVDDRIRTGLILSEIAEKESLKVEDIDVTAAIAEQAAEEKSTPAAVRALLERRGTMDALHDRILTRKVLSFLRASAITTDVVVATDSDEPSDDKKTTRTITSVSDEKVSD